MSDPHWEKVKDIFQAALDKPASEREPYLNEACGDDRKLRADVSELLASFAEADDFLDESPIGEIAAAIIERNEIVSAGQMIGRYRIERKLGAGGMGEVFLARDTELERFVALKILSAAFSGNPDRVRRFVQEARAASALNHPNILTIYEIGHFENVRFIATEYVEGETLRERRRGNDPLAFDEILDVFSQTSAALSAAHDAGIVHRDIKPENIMIRRDGLVKVLDFGLAKLLKARNAERGTLNEDAETLTHSSEINPQSAIGNPQLTSPGMVMGTVAYMSPEQARGLPTDARTDVWSLGVCLSEIASGAQPFAGDTVSDQIAAILKSEPDFGGENAPFELRRIIEKCLEKNAADRYQSVKEFAHDIKNLGRKSELSDETEFSFARSNGQNNGGETGRLSGGQTAGRTTFATQNSLPPRSSSAEYIVGEIKKRKWLSVSAIGLLISISALVLYFSVFSGLSNAKPINSIAVLPFVNESDDSNDEYLSDGLSESLINKLSQLPQLKVASRSSAFKYKGKNAEPSEIAESLGVEAIVTGKIAHRGDDLQISVELVSAADNTQIWGENYRRKVADAQAIQEEIAQNILQKLRLKLSGTDERRVAIPITNNSQAYQLYLNGVFFRRKNGADNLKKAIEYQNQAIALDPNFALAYTELAHDQFNLVIIGAIDPKTGIPPARRAIEKALSIDDTLAEAHDINSSLKASDFDWAGAVAEIQRAIELNPNLAGAHTGYAEYLSTIGRFDEALREIKRAQELDPLRTGLIGNEGIILFRARRFDEALVKFERDDPDAATTPFPHIVLARAYAAKNRYRDAIIALRRSLAVEETSTALIHLGRASALAGEREDALVILERLKKTDKYVSPAELAILYAALEMREPAFESLERAFAERDFMLPLINVEPEYDALRGDPRFAEILRRINL